MLKRVFDTTHLSALRESLVYNFFDTIAEAENFVRANQNNPAVIGLTINDRMWCPQQSPSREIKSKYWGDRIYNTVNEIWGTSHVL